MEKAFWSQYWHENSIDKCQRKRVEFVAFVCQNSMLPKVIHIKNILVLGMLCICVYEELPA